MYAVVNEFCIYRSSLLLLEMVLFFLVCLVLVWLFCLFIWCLFVLVLVVFCSVSFVALIFCVHLTVAWPGAFVGLVLLRIYAHFSSHRTHFKLCSSTK